MRKGLSFCIAFLLSALLLTSVVPMSPVYGADCAMVRVSQAAAKPGDQQVEITLELSENPGICGMILHISYDPRLTLEHVERGSALSSLTMASFFVPYLNPLTASWDGIRSDSTNGSLLTLIFSVPAGAEQGDYAISVSYRSGDIYDDNLEDLELTTENGYIRVNSPSVHKHSMTWVPQTPATCCTPETSAHWCCTSCQKQYLDYQGTSETNVINWTLNPNNHAGGTEVRNAKAATADSMGYTGDIYCLGCSRRIYSGQLIPQLSSGTTSSSTTQQETPQQPPKTPEVATEWVNPFTDVSPKDRYYEAVRFVNQRGLFQGVSSTEFAPNVTMTRAMFVTVLGRLAGVDVNLYKNVQFQDVKANEWYTAYVGWAEEKGIVEGYGNGYFGVNDTITIEQAGVILERYARFIGQDTSSDIALLHYDDADRVSQWAEKAMYWLVQHGIYEGENHLLTPQAPASRAQVAEFLYIFVTYSES